MRAEPIPGTVASPTLFPAERIPKVWVKACNPELLCVVYLRASFPPKLSSPRSQEFSRLRRLVL